MFKCISNKTTLDQIIQATDGELYFKPSCITSPHKGIEVTISKALLVLYESKDASISSKADGERGKI